MNLYLSFFKRFQENSLFYFNKLKWSSLSGGKKLKVATTNSNLAYFLYCWYLDWKNSTIGELPLISLTHPFIY